MIAATMLFCLFLVLLFCSGIDGFKYLSGNVFAASFISKTSVKSPYLTLSNQVRLTSQRPDSSISQSTMSNVPPFEELKIESCVLQPQLSLQDLFRQLRRTDIDIIEFNNILTDLRRLKIGRSCIPIDVIQSIGQHILKFGADLSRFTLNIILSLSYLQLTIEDFTIETRNVLLLNCYEEVEYHPKRILRAISVMNWLYKARNNKIDDMSEDMRADVLNALDSVLPTIKHISVNTILKFVSFYCIVQMYYNMLL